MSLLAPVVPLNRSETCPNATVYVSPACPPEMGRPDGAAWCVRKRPHERPLGLTKFWLSRIRLLFCPTIVLGWRGPPLHIQNCYHSRIFSV